MESKKFCGSSVASEDQNVQTIMPLTTFTFVFSSLCSVSLWVSGNGKLWLVCWKDWCVLASLPLTPHHSPFVLRPTLLTTNATLHNIINIKHITTKHNTVQYQRHNATPHDRTPHNTAQLTAASFFTVTVVQWQFTSATVNAHCRLGKGLQKGNRTGSG